MFQRFKAIWKEDWTRIGVWFQGANIAALGFINTLASYVNDPTLKDYLTQLEAPKSVFYFLSLIGLISFIALKGK